MKYLLPSFIALSLICGGITPAMSQDVPEKVEEKAAETPAKEKAEEPKAAPKKAVKKKQEEDASKPTPIDEWITAENKLIDTLAQKDKDAFFVMRNKHSVIRSVRIVDRDVGNAVQACGKNNPEMKDKIYARFASWQGAVRPILDTAEKFLKEEIETQKVVFSSDFKHVLKLNDKAYEYGEKQIQKEPITTLEACEGLVESMDDTEDQLIELLQDALLPESVIRERVERAEREKTAE